MTIGIPPQPHYFPQVGRTLNKPFLPNSHFVNPITLTAPVDSFVNERNILLATLENPTLFEAVLDESKPPTPQIKALRTILSKRKINTQELFKSQALLKNLYNHLAIQAEKQLKTTTNKTKQEELKLQVAMMRSLVDSINRNGQSFSPPLVPLSTSKHQAITNTVKFGDLTSLFAKTIMLFTTQGKPNEKEPYERKAASDKIINVGSTLAAGAAGALTKIAFADDAALTAITVGTITRMAYGVYGIEDTSPAALGVILGKVAGARIADGALNYALEKGLAAIPLLGEITTAATAFSLHQATCRLFRLYFEKQIDQGETPGFPLSLRALSNGLGLAQATHLVDLGSEQYNHYNTLNDVRAESNYYEATSNSYMELSSGKIQEIHNILDQPGNLIGIPGKEDFLNSVLAAASTADDVIQVATALSKTTPYLARNIITEFRNNDKISAKSLNDLLELGGDLSIGALLLLGGPNQIQNPGMLENLDLQNTLYRYFQENGLDVDYKAIAGWTSVFGVHMREHLRAKVVQKVENSPAYKAKLQEYIMMREPQPVAEVRGLRTAQAIDKIVNPDCVIM